MEDLPSINCMICERKLASKKSYNDHLKIHNGEKPFKCADGKCDKAFIQFSSFQKHTRVHSRQRPYSCLQCPDNFTQVSNLKRHIKIVHEKEKPFVCEYCNERFGTNSNLSQHIEKHKSKDTRKVYTCKDCQNTYFHHSSLNKHMKVHSVENSQDSEPTKKVKREMAQTLNAISTMDNTERKLSEITFFSEIPLLIRKYSDEQDEQSNYSENKSGKEENGCSPVLKSEHCDCIMKEELPFLPEISQCLCSVLEHEHSEMCGHPQVKHGNHYDFLVNETLHFPHGNHCDSHGKIEVD